MEHIGLVNYIKSLFTKSTYISDFSDLISDYNRTHLKQSALDTVIGKIINASSLVDLNTENEYLSFALNTKANDNQSANELRAKIITNLLTEGECLIIPRNNKLYVADSWIVEGKEFEEKTYKDIVVGNEVIRKMKAGDVYHPKYHNDKLKRYLNDLDQSYGKLFERMIQIHMREQQIRVYAKFKLLNPISNEETSEARISRSQKEMRNYLYDIKNQIENEHVAMLAKQDGYDIEERIQNQVGRSVEELAKIEDMYVRQVANILQVPPLIFSGDLADVTEHNNNFVRWCIRPLMEIIVNEINAKTFSRDQFKNDEHVTINTIWVIYNSEFEMAKDIRTMIESGRYTIDDILKLQGRKTIGSKITTQRYLTKNMAPLNEDGSVNDSKKNAD